MANHAVLSFLLDFVSDGVSTTLAQNVGTIPIIILHSGNQLSLTFTAAVAAAITALTNITVNGYTGASAVIASGVITFTFTGPPPPVGTRCTVQGNIQF
jgi:hypothetical protein